MGHTPFTSMRWEGLKCPELTFSEQQLHLIFIATRFSPWTVAKKIFATTVLLLLWLLGWIVSGRKILALYLTNTLESKNFNIEQTWIRMFLKCTICFECWHLHPVGCRCANEKEEEQRTKKKMEKWDYFEYFKNHLNPLSMDKVLLCSVFKKTQSKVLEDFTDKFEAKKLLFPCALLFESFKNFWPVPIMNHYCGS